MKNTSFVNIYSFLLQLMKLVPKGQDSFHSICISNNKQENRFMHEVFGILQSLIDKLKLQS